MAAGEKNKNLPLAWGLSAESNSTARLHSGKMCGKKMQFKHLSKAKNHWGLWANNRKRSNCSTGLLLMLCNVFSEMLVSSSILCSSSRKKQSSWSSAKHSSQCDESHRILSCWRFFGKCYLVSDFCSNTAKVPLISNLPVVSFRRIWVTCNAKTWFPAFAYQAAQWGQAPSLVASACSDPVEPGCASF